MAEHPDWRIQREDPRVRRWLEAACACTNGDPMVFWQAAAVTDPAEALAAAVESGELQRSMIGQDDALDWLNYSAVGEGGLRTPTPGSLATGKAPDVRAPLAEAGFRAWLLRVVTEPGAAGTRALELGEGERCVADLLAALEGDARHRRWCMRTDFLWRVYDADRDGRLPYFEGTACDVCIVSVGPSSWHAILNNPYPCRLVHGIG